MGGALAHLRKLRSDEHGAITIIGALVLVSVIGVSALALEYGHGLLQKSENQRVADLAAYGGALVYASTSSTTSATSAASNIVSLNGLSCNSCASVVTSPTGDGNNAVEVSVTTNVPLLMARVLTTKTTLPVTATSYAEVQTSAPGCVIALSGSGSGVSLSGSATVSAPNCAVASNATLTSHACSNTITTDAVDYNGTAPSPTCAFQTSGGSTPPINKRATTDPLGASSGSPGSTEVTNATARISTVSSNSSPAAPTGVPTGTNVTFDSGGKKSTTASSLTTIGCSGSISSSVWTVTCSGTGPFNFGNFTNSGVTVNITNTSSGATYNFSGLVDTGTSNGVTFNGGSNATYNLASGIYAHGSATMSFSAGTFNIGTTSCSSAPSPGTGYSICITGSGSLTFAGPSAFNFAGGIYQCASGMPGSPPVALSLGYGSTTNTFNIGASTTTAYSLDEANGATLLGDASGTSTVSCGSTNSTFCMAGSVITSGGTCVALGTSTNTTPQHDIDGNLNAAGGIVLGARVYTINGYVALGNGGGGDVSNCPTSGTTTGLTALGVTLIVSGASTVTCGSTTSAFCLGARYSTVDITAPSSGSTANMAVIGPQSSSNTAGAAFTNGATNTRISGAFYFPNGPIVMSGAATLHDTVDSSACLELVGSQVTLSNGSAAGSTCTGLSSSSLGTTITMVQ